MASQPFRRRSSTAAIPVVALGRYGGVYKATGVKVNAQFVHVFRFKDGKVASFQQYTDTAQFKDAVSRRAGAWMRKGSSLATKSGVRRVDVQAERPRVLPAAPASGFRPACGHIADT